MRANITILDQGLEQEQEQELECRKVLLETVTDIADSSVSS